MKRAEQLSEKSLGKAPAVESGVPSSTLPSTTPADADDTDAETCFICASTVQHTAVTPCNHRTCHICSLRLRALYKVKTCAHCRTESDHVIFTDNHTKNYEEFSPKDFFKTIESLGIRFENEDILTDTQLLLRFNCPDAECDVACLGWPDLHRHVQTAHGKKMWYVPPKHVIRGFADSGCKRPVYTEQEGLHSRA